MPTSELIVTAARGWIGTRFSHQGRLKKTSEHAGGVDCLGLLIGVASELELCKADGTPLASLDELDYPHYPDTARLSAKLAATLKYVQKDTIVPADIILLAIDNMPQHLAIVSHTPHGLGMIHAYAPARCVIEHALDDWWSARIWAVFRII